VSPGRKTKKSLEFILVWCPPRLRRCRGREGLTQRKVDPPSVWRWITEPPQCEAHSILRRKPRRRGNCRRVFLRRSGGGGGGGGGGCCGGLGGGWVEIDSLAATGEAQPVKKKNKGLTSNPNQTVRAQSPPSRYLQGFTHTHEGLPSRNLGWVSDGFLGRRASEVY